MKKNLHSQRNSKMQGRRRRKHFDEIEPHFCETSLENFRYTHTHTRSIYSHLYNFRNPISLVHQKSNHLNGRIFFFTKTFTKNL